MSLPGQEQKLREFFAQPEAEQWKQIDCEIDAKEAKRRQAGGRGGTKDNGRGGNGRGQARVVDGPKDKGKAKPNADPRHIMSMKQEWTANASPELRSMMDRRVQMMRERRRQRGLQTL